MNYLGDFHKGQSVYCYLATTDSAGANVAPSSAFENADVVVYQDGSNAQITAGITVTSPFDTETGFHLAVIDTSNAAFARGNDFTIVLAPDETVDSQTITALPLAQFSLENRMSNSGGFRTTIATLSSQTSFTLTDGPADDDALNGWVLLVKDAATSHQMCLGVVSDYTGSTATVTLQADPGIFTMAANDYIEAIPALATTAVNANVTQISGDATAADNLESYCDGTTPIPSNAIQISGDATAADNLEAALDGTGGVTISADIDGASTLVDDVWDEVLTSGTHNVGNSSGRRLRNIQDFGIYDLASVWVDEANGTSTGTTDGEDATVTNRADDFDNAQTIADSVGINTIQISNGNSITLAAGLEGYNLYGNGSAIALGGQNAGGSIFRQFSNVTGIAASTSDRIIFEDCLFGAVTLPPAVLQRVGLGGTLTFGSAGNFDLHDCYSIVAGASTPTIDMGSGVGSTNLSVRKWSGGLTLSNLASGDVVTLEGTFGAITLNGADATVEIRGIAKSVTNNLTGSPTVNNNAVLSDAGVIDSNIVSVIDDPIQESGATDTDWGGAT